MEAEAELNQARAFLEQGLLNEAASILRSRVQRDASIAEDWFLMARIARLAGDLESAERMIDAAVELKSDQVEYWMEKGRVMTAFKGPLEAVAAYRRVLELDDDHFEAHSALGEIYSTRGQFQAALPHFERASRINPQSPDTQSQLGEILDRLGFGSEAERAFLKCLELEPNHVRTLLRLGNVYRDRRQPSRAKEFYDRALRQRPHDPYILSNVANSLMDLGDAAAALSTYERSLTVYPDQPTTHSNFLFSLYYVSGIPRESIVAAHLEWNRRYAEKIEPLGPFQNHDFSGDRPLRVGFVSADFHNHPVGRFADVLFRNANPEQMQFFAYTAGAREDHVTRGIRDHASHWRPIQDLGDRQVATAMRADQLDILIDLSGHTSGNRLLIFPHRAAPVQISSWVYPGTTGLRSIDYRMTDPYADPIDATMLKSPETLIRLPKISWIYQAPDSSPEPASAPCLQGHRFTFGCLNNPNKLSNATVALWSEVLQRCPEARLILLSWAEIEHAEFLRDRFLRSGVAEGQLSFRLRGTTAAYLGYHAEIDVMLDPFPYNGCTTTCDALWMGVPVLTLAGDYYMSRQGVSFLSNLDLPGCIAGSSEDFVAKAVALARSPEMAQQLRTGLRERLQSSPLMDYAAYVRDMGNLLREVWRQRCLSKE
jgi:protein O-GlcNAc transferase